MSIIFQAGWQGGKNPDGVYSYRIPALLVSQTGRILAACDQRKDHNGDWGNIDLVYRYSDDQGQNWAPVKTMVDLATNPKANHPDWGSALTMDMCLVQDKASGRIYALYDMFPQVRGCFGLLESGFNEKAYIKHGGDTYYLLYSSDGDREIWGYLDFSGQVYDINWQKTAYQVCLQSSKAPFHDLGQTTFHGESLGNIYFVDHSNLPFRLAQHMFIWLSYSDDDGGTWACPCDITCQIKQDWMVFFGIGPGIGRCLEHGPHQGRLIVPVYSTNHLSQLDGSQSSAIIYSDDHGLTWHYGQSVNDGRELDDGQIIWAKSMDDFFAQTTEAVPLELKSGLVLLLMRNRTGRVQMACSRDGGQTWNRKVQTLEQIVDVYCQLSAISSSYMDREYVFIINAGGPNRTHGCIHVFGVGPEGLDKYLGYYQINEGKFAYCALQVINHSLVFAYETAQEAENDYSIYFEKVSIHHVLNNLQR